MAKNIVCDECGRELEFEREKSYLAKIPEGTSVSKEHYHENCYNQKKSKEKIDI